MNIELTGKLAVVVGGTSGINLGVAQYLAELGANLVVVSRKQDKVDAAVTALQALGGGSAWGFTADVRQADDIKAGFATLHEMFGEIDILVSGAAGNFPARAKDMSSNGFKSVMDIDLLGSFHVAQAAYPYLKKPGASVIQISAPQAFVPMATQSHVCAAKAGVDMLTKTLAMEWGSEGIRVNSVVPGPIAGTEGMARLAPTEKIQQQIQLSVPLRRMGKPKDVAQVCAFLASDYASYVSGVIMPVDGGWSLSGAAALASQMDALLPQT